MSKPMIIGGSAEEVVSAINFFTKKNDFNDKDKATAINKFKMLVKNKALVDNLVKKTINDAFVNVGINNLNMDFSDSKQAEQFVTNKLNPPLPIPPASTQPLPQVTPPAASAVVKQESVLPPLAPTPGGERNAANDVTVQPPPSQQPDADINGRIRALIGEDAPKIDDFAPGPDATTELYINAINQRIDAAQAVHNKYPVPTQSQASDLETAIKASPVADVRTFTVKKMEGGGKRKRRKQTKKKKHKRK
jgi:hypothetical protein